MNTSKIIKAAVGGGKFTITAPIIKEDHGIYLQIEGVNLPETYEVDFSNDEHKGTSVTMIGNADGVLIPTQFIKSGRDIFAFLYHVGEGYGRTVYKFRIPNKLRPDRTDEEPTPEEQSVIDQAIAALNAAVENTAQDVETTARNVTETDRNATRAEQARDRAEAARDSASNSADSAGRSAESAANSEQRATEKAGEAKTSADNADHSANLAQQVAITNGYMEVRIVDGHLIYERTDSVDTDFSLNAVGHLIMESVAT